MRTNKLAVQRARSPLLRVHAEHACVHAADPAPAAASRQTNRPGCKRATESILVSARRPFFALRRRKFVCRCLNTPAVSRVDGDPSPDTFGDVDEPISHTSIRSFAIFTTAPSARERQAIRSSSLAYRALFVFPARSHISQLVYVK